MHTYKIGDAKEGSVVETYIASRATERNKGFAISEGRWQWAVGG